MRLVLLTLLSAAISDGYSQRLMPGRLDSIQRVREVVVVSRPAAREVIPAQRLQGGQLEKLGGHSVADAVRYFSGLQIKDYGGVGGIKTVNVRSMGSAHLGVFYDGVELGNAQNGQVDLGQLSLDNVEEIALYNGQRSAIFQPAGDFGNAGSVYIRTKVPKFVPGKSYNLKFRASYGSSGEVFRFSTLYEQRLSSAVCASLNAESLTATGKYKFRYKRNNTDGSTAYDTTAVRQNGDVWAFRAEANVYGILPRGQWSFKAYMYNSGRGIPGAIVNNVWRRGERQWDHNMFVQGSVQKSFGDRFSTRLLAKYAYYNTRYANRDTTSLLVDNKYRQQEFYVSTANVYEIVPGWSVSMSYDFRWNKLNSDMRAFVYPHRYSNFVSVASAVDLRRFKMQGSLLGTFVKDHTLRMADKPSVYKLTPAVFVSVYPFATQDFSVRAFAKKSFRMPTFNELYYADMGNAMLRPETAVQYDLGLVFDRHWAGRPLRHFRIQADGYYNAVRDKVIAYPKGQQFRWTMLNLGRVRILGADVGAEAVLCPVGDLFLTGRVQYTYQQARDVTDPSTSFYNDQIPYIPWHSGSVVLGVGYRSFDFNYSFIYAGERYSQQENILANHLQPWYTSDVSMTYRFDWRKTRFRLTLEINNLFSQDYDVIINYPMPKRNYALSVDVVI